MATQPGTQFVVWREPQAPEPVSRMDIAGLVGFAASGPLNLPVRIEGERAFAEIFGADLDLVWDGEEGRVHRAFLGPAVRSFFRNGGKSCWVVRVADPKTAVAGRFQIPGLAVALPGGGFGAAVLAACSPGSWSDELCVGATLRSAALTSIAYRPGGWVLHDQVREGDLLRLSRTVFGETWQLYLFAETVSPAAGGSWQVEGPVFWFGPAAEIPLGTVRVTRGAAPSPATAAGGTPGVDGTAGVAAVDGDGVEWMPSEPAPPGTAPTEGVWRQQASSDRLWQLILPHDRTILPGTVLDVSDGRERLLFTVASVADATAEDLDLCGAAMVSRAGRLMVATGRPPLRPVPADALPEGLLDGRWSVDRLTLDLWTEDASSVRRVASGLGFHPACSTYLGYLPTDDQFYATYTAGQVQPDGAPAWEGLTPLISSPRFPLAAVSGDTPLFLPLAADTQTDLLYQPQPPLRNPRPALERDGLEDLNVSLFVAPEVELLDGANLSEAVATTPQPAGIHALWPIDEVTLLAVPDAVHLGWPALLELRPSMAGVQAAQPDAGAPVLARPRMAGPGPYTLRWTPVGATRYVLQVGRHETDFAGATEYVTEELSYTLWWDGRGLIHFRVAPWPEGQPAPGPWSNTVTLREPDNRWPFWYRHPTPGNIADATAFITRVHSALLRMARTRGDLFAVMALPREYSVRDALAYVRELTRIMHGDALSFGAIYVPWLHLQEVDGSTTIAPPDGAALGQIAGRTIAQGAWVAPANLPLQSVAGLDRTIDGAPLEQLSDAQVNVYVQEVLGDLAHTANTLSQDSDLMPLGTRRLLSLLRRILTDAGMDAVFQPDDRRHRLAVKTRLDQELSDLFRRGALAGDTAAQAFQVTADDTVNPPGSVREGRLIVDIRIAPARSLTFLTIRLFENQAGRPVVTEG